MATVTSVWAQVEAEYGVVRAFFAKYPWLTHPTVGVAAWLAGRFIHWPI